MPLRTFPAKDWKASSIIKSLFAINKGSVVLLSVLLTSCFYIFKPMILESPILSVNGNRLSIKVSPHFQTLKISFETERYIMLYTMTPYIPVEDRDKRLQASYHNSNDIYSFSKTIIIERHILKVPPEHAYAIQAIEVTIAFKDIDESYINDIVVDGKKVNMRNFFDNNIISKERKYIDRTFIRNDIAKVLIKFNDDVSNVIMTIMAVYLIPLILELTAKRFILFRALHFQGTITRKYNLSATSSENDKEAAKADYMMKCLSNEKRYSFLQVAGPAFGFVLTISSLIVGLHPSLRSRSNMEEFFTAIQIAMISTFIGLIIRIVAIFLERTNDRLIISADDAFFNLKRDIKKTSKIAHRNNKNG